MTKAAQNSEKTARLAPYRFKPGQSGNAGGRSKKKPLTELYERILADPKNIAAIEKAVTKVLLKGNMAMVLLLREMAERVEGKVTQPIEASVTMNLAEAIAEARKRVAKPRDEQRAGTQ